MVEWRGRRKSRERKKFGVAIQMGRNPEINNKMNGPTAEINPPKQKLISAVDRSIGP